VAERDRERVGGGSLPCVGGPWRRRRRGLDLLCRRLVPGDCGHARHHRPTGLAARLGALPIAAERLPHCLDLALLPHGPNDTAGPGCRLRGERFVKRRREPARLFALTDLRFPSAPELTLLQEHPHG